MRDGARTRATVVITGASSGIGRATARAFARRGCHLVLAARRLEPLARARDECAALGAHAIAVPTDVTDARAMRDLARFAVQAFGRIDVWVNNAGVGVVGPFEAAPVEDHARTIEVNLLGAVHGAHAVLPHFFAQGGRGVIINLASIGAYLPIPWGASYGASKAGLAAFTDSLRHELAARSRIEVCAVYPTFVDTPAHAHAANYSGRSLQRLRPRLEPEDVAEAIVHLARHPRRALNLGMPPGTHLAGALLPDSLGRLIGRITRRMVLETGAAAPHTDGTLLEPAPGDPGVHGDWERDRRRGLSMRTVALAALAVGAAALLTAGARRARA